MVVFFVIANVEKDTIAILKLEGLDKAFQVRLVAEVEVNLRLGWGEEDAMFPEVELGTELFGGEVFEEAIAVFPEGVCFSLGVILAEMIRT